MASNKSGKRTTKRKAVAKKKNLYSERTVGVILALIGFLGIFHLGYLGILVTNIFRLFIGDAAVFGIFLLLIFSVYLIIYGKEPQIQRRYYIAVTLLILGIVLGLEAFFFSQLDLHSEFIKVTWQYVISDIVGANLGTAVGGGMLGALLYAVTYFLLSQIGSYFVSGVLLFSGICVLFGISFQQVIQLISKIGLQLWNWLLLCLDCLKKSGGALWNWLLTYIKNSNCSDHPSPSVEKTVETSQLKPANRDSVVFDDFKNAKPATEHEVTPDVWNSSEFEESKKAIQTTSKKLSDLKSISNYQLPSVDLLQDVAPIDQSQERKAIKRNQEILRQTLKSFGVDAELKNTILGPSVTKYELHPAIGVKVSKIVNLTDDLALALAAKDIRIEAPIPGKSLIGIEVPNRDVATISFKDVITAEKQQKHQLLEVPLGRDVAGKLVTLDITKTPHLLIAGSTGSGKSVAINGIITSLLMNCTPDEVKLMLVDPKKVELGVYNGIPHLISPVVTESKKAAISLNKLVAEMERRYETFANIGVRNIDGYNRLIQGQKNDGDETVKPMPYIVGIVDELADLMMVSSNEVEGAIIRIAQMGRAAGIHMIIATQRPSVDVITGLIKANVPSRIAFAVSSGIDSRTILDQNGAEKLLGRGDMLFKMVGKKPVRVQGAFISDEDVEKITSFVRQQGTAEYDDNLAVSDEEVQKVDSSDEADTDPLFSQVVDFIRQEQKVSISLLQRRFKIGYNRAARIVDALTERGMVGPQEGSKPRKVYLPKKEE